MLNSSLLFSITNNHVVLLVHLLNDMYFNSIPFIRKKQFPLSFLCLDKYSLVRILYGLIDGLGVDSRLEMIEINIFDSEYFHYIHMISF